MWPTRKDAEDYAIYCQLGVQLDPEYEQICRMLWNKMVPEAYPDIDEKNNFWGENALSRSSLVARDAIIKLSGFAFVAYEWVRPLSRWIGNRKCLEIMCGSGTLAYALRECGTWIIATDNGTWSSAPRWFEKPWTDVRNVDCVKAIEMYGKDVDFVVCSWPYMDDMAYRCLLKMREINPLCKMIYIGEWEGGATANNDFFATLKEINDSEFEAAVANYKQSWGIHDRPYLIN